VTRANSGIGGDGATQISARAWRRFLAGSMTILLILRRTTISPANPLAFLRQPGHQAHCLTRGIAPSPHGEFALVGKESPLWDVLCENRA